MSCYQNIAENGVKAACQGSEKILPGPDTLVGFIPADGQVLLDTIFGVGANFLTSVDPAVTSEGAPGDLNPDLVARQSGWDSHPDRAARHRCLPSLSHALLNRTPLDCHGRVAFRCDTLDQIVGPRMRPCHTR